MRSDDGCPGASASSRRAVLAATGGLTAGAIGTAGCLGSADGVRVLAAGSLVTPLEDGIGPAFESETGSRYEGEYYGTNALLRLVEDGTKQPDVVIGADVALLRERLYPDHADWDAAFAANEVVIAYAPETDLGSRLAAGEPWYEVLGSVPAARTDPALDPLGYRTVQLFQLAESHYGVDGLAAALREHVRVAAREAHLLAGVERGRYEAAVCYENMAAGRDLPSVDLPAALDFSDPARADRYARASYDPADGPPIPGRPVAYAATVPTAADHSAAGRRFVTFLCERPDLLREWGLSVPSRLPAGHGAVPDGMLP